MVAQSNRLLLADHSLILDMFALQVFVCVCVAVQVQREHTSPNYNDNVSQCWRNIHHACLAFGIKHRRAITGLSNHFTAPFSQCVCFPVSVS